MRPSAFAALHKLELVGLPPGRVAALRGLRGVRVVAVSCGFYHTAAVSDDGAVYTWGWGNWGQLGHSESSPQPARVDALRAQLEKGVSL